MSLAPRTIYVRFKSEFSSRPINHLGANSGVRSISRVPFRAPSGGHPATCWSVHRNVCPGVHLEVQIGTNRYVGPFNSVDSFFIWSKESANSVQRMENGDVNEKNGSVGEGDEPVKRLYETGPSNHHGPFRHLFMSLVEIVLPVEISIGNAYANYYWTVLLIMRVDEKIQRIKGVRSGTPFTASRQYYELLCSINTPECLLRSGRCSYACSGPYSSTPPHQKLQDSSPCLGTVTVPS